MAKVIMIQGTMSGVGKSMLVAGLCRIFKRNGYRAAPFKSQNMALNSFITRDGLEMGRAQVMQAEAAGLEPDVRMNPVLLKPTSDTGSQVIVGGEVRGVMDARAYFSYKKQLIPDITAAFGSLASESDIVVIEGAGSPAEINLKEADIVNMGMAKLVKAPVLLAGDIDRGGVFAQLIGTVDLLEEDERRLVKGLVINKFRGDRTILDPGIEMLERRAKIPVVGVVPFMDVDLEDEDSLSERLGASGAPGAVDIAVIRLPRISNFTDMNAFGMIPGVSVRYCGRASQLGEPDMVVLPGSKNTIGDLLWMRESGMEAAVKKLAAKGCRIFGICGGYQMLGETISDPAGVESGGTVSGMGLLPVDTVFEESKTRTRVTGRFVSGYEDLEVSGYEIHMGRSTLHGGAQPLLELEVWPEGERKPDGAVSGRVCGTYVHGFFDGEGIALRTAEELARGKGVSLAAAGAENFAAYKERQYDLLADTLEASLDMRKIYEILEEGI